MVMEELNEMLPNDIDAAVYFERIRWGEQNKCAYCNSPKISQRQADNRFHCSSCRRTFSVTTGTMLHSSKLPLKLWLYAFSNYVKPGYNLTATKLKRELNISYSTAWYMFNDINKLINPMVREIFSEEQLLNFICRKAMQTVEKENAQAA